MLEGGKLSPVPRRVLREVGQLPVAPGLHPAVAAQQVVSRLKLVDAAERTERRRHVLEGQVVVDRDRVHRPLGLSILEQRLELGGEGQPRAREPVEERLDPEAVAREEQRAPPSVPDREGEHPPQAVEAAHPVSFVEAQQDLGVGARAKAGAGPEELLPELHEVVDLAVEHDPYRAVVVPHRLVAGGREVDDAESPVPEPDRPIGVDALAVRPSVRERRAHPEQQVLPHRAGGIEVELAGDAAHEWRPT